MESRKVSSLSVTSDGSDSSLPRASNLILEQIGTLNVAEVKKTFYMKERFIL